VKGSRKGVNEGGGGGGGGGGVGEGGRGQARGGPAVHPIWLYIVAKKCESAAHDW